jgi:EAL domain-containing protein (putative c-di-GMP-specific phosphodiesterase class I)
MQPRFLELELTESVLMGTVREHAGVIQRLRDTGITFAIDDFGTGYSSLEYLRRFRSNRLKIAQTFVRNLETTPENASIVRATISLARELGISVIAEGVETRQQVELLKGWGCTQIQGFYFSKPLSAEDATRALRTGVILAPVPAAVEVVAA